MQERRNKSINKETILVKVYELRDPMDLECKPRYVGITIETLNCRLSKHIYNSEKIKKSTYKTNWIKSLSNKGIKPTIHLIEEVVGWNYACEVEKYYIKEFKEQGYRLTNTTKGGDGNVGLIMSEENKKKMSLFRTGKKLSKETKDKISKAGKGLKRSEETKKRISRAKTGVILSDETKAKISQKRKSQIMDKEHINKLIEGRRKKLIVTLENGEQLYFKSITECSIKLNLSYKTVTGYIKNKPKKRKYEIIIKIFKNE